MYYTYILQNSISLRYYIGSTNDLDRRLNEHSRGQTRSTKQKGSWKLIYVEKHLDYIQAKKREKVIKSYKGGNAFKKLLTKNAVVVQR